MTPDERAQVEALIEKRIAALMEDCATLVSTLIHERDGSRAMCVIDGLKALRDAQQHLWTAFHTGFSEWPQ